jgi:ribosomal protein L31
VLGAQESSWHREEAALSLVVLLLPMREEKALQVAVLGAQEKLAQGRGSTTNDVVVVTPTAWTDSLQVICNGEEVLTVSGTKEKYVVDVWSGNHPFFQVRCILRFRGLSKTLVKGTAKAATCFFGPCSLAAGNFPAHHSTAYDTEGESQSFLAGTGCMAGPTEEMSGRCRVAEEVQIMQGRSVSLIRRHGLLVQGTTEALILDEGRVNKFNKRFASLGAYGQVGLNGLSHKLALPCGQLLILALHAPC